MKLKILTKKKSARLSYTLSLIFDERNIDWQLITDVEDFKNASRPKFSYQDLQTSPFNIKSSTLLFEDEIRSYSIEKTEWNHCEILQFNGEADILASIFYVASLYDDYLQTTFDLHGRNVGKQSLLYRFGWLNQLVVERWCECIIQWIEKQNNCDLNAQKIPFSIIPTFDIDHAYAYKYRKKWREQLSKGKDLIQKNRIRLKERKAVLAGKIKDPFDTFDTIEKIAQEGFDVKVFWLLGKYSKFDRNIDVNHPKQVELIKRMSRITDIGLHPSYQSDKERHRLQKEKQILENILNGKISHSRQHFLKVKMPSTFQQLEKVGFTDDYSLSYADEVGFRAGLSRPFLWFDLSKNSVSNLTLHPISYMDGTLNEYMGLSISKAIEKVKEIKAEIQRYGGEFIPLWHNETIGNYGIWEDWVEVLEESLK